MPLASGLFGAHVHRRSDKLVLRALAEILVAQGDSKIGDVGLGPVVDQDVFGLDIAVNQSLGVGVMECLRDRGDDFRRLGQRKGLLLHPSARLAPSMNLETT